MMEELMHEAAENQSFSNFRNEVTNGLNNQEEYEVLQNLKKNLNNDIIKINEDLKNKQDEFAKEAQESQDDIAKFKKLVNETQIDSQLQIELNKSEIDGRLQCLQRSHKRLESELENHIKSLKEELDAERIVSDKIREFIQKRKGVIEDQADHRDKLREKKLLQLTEEKDEIQNKKEEAD